MEAEVEVEVQVEVQVEVEVGAGGGQIAEVQVVGTGGRKNFRALTTHRVAVLSCTAATAAIMVGHVERYNRISVLLQNRSGPCRICRTSSLN